MKMPALLRTAKRLYHEQRGVVLIEMVVVLPVLLLLVFGVISFGYVFVVFEDEAIAVSSSASAIQTNPGNGATTRAFALTSGQPWISFTGSNTICAQSFAQGAALPTPYCSGATWNTGTPAGVPAGTAYVVAVEAQVTPTLALPNTYSWLLGQTFTQKTTATVAGALNYPTCTAGQYITSTDGITLTCSSPTTPSGTFCGNDYVAACDGTGATNTPLVTETPCIVGGTSYNPTVSCPSGYSQYMYVDAAIKSAKANCYYTCIKN